MEPMESTTGNKAQVVGLRPLTLKGEMPARQAGPAARLAIIDTLLGMLANDADPQAPLVAEKLREQRAELIAQMEGNDG